MKVVLDTNVVVSAFLSPGGKPAAIVELVFRGDLQPCFNTAILAEYEHVLYRSKFALKIPARSVARFFEVLHAIGLYVIAAPSAVELPDETDRWFYDVAKASGAFVITGNKRHYPDEPFILSPAEFLDMPAR